MAFAFNPITGKLDLVGSGGSATTDASLLTSGTLADARLSSRVSFDDINNNFTAGQSITAAANTSALTASYSVTGANTTPLLDLSGTWNTTGIARGILLNITDTASAATSKLFELQQNSVPRFSVFRHGGVSIQVATTAYAIEPTNNSFRFMVGGIDAGAFRIDGLRVPVGGGVLWSISGLGSSSYDLSLLRDAANTLALRNGGTAASPVPQNFRIYNWQVDSSNYERGFMRWNSNTLEIGTEAGGTGSARGVNLLVGSNAASFSASGSGVRANFRDAIVGYGLYGAGASPANVLLKASGTSWMVRNGTDASFGSIQGKLTTDTAYTATMIIPTGYVTIYDSTGTAYKVACSL